MENGKRIVDKSVDKWTTYSFLHFSVHKNALFDEKERVMFKVVKLRTLLSAAGVLLAVAVITVGVTLGVRAKEARAAFSPLPKPTVVSTRDTAAPTPG